MRSVDCAIIGDFGFAGTSPREKAINFVVEYVLWEMFVDIHTTKYPTKMYLTIPTDVYANR